MAEIFIEIDKKTGQISVEGSGYQGGQCIKDIDELEKILGLNTVSERAKPELVRQVRTITNRR